MSRRESRVSINVRQNDALNEFENFKKKFLLANKHITKLNSTLSVRIEELNAQISTLYVENLRLRASEIALASQLQREREKSWRIMTDAEAATHNLSKQLGHLRRSFNISHSSPIPPQQPPAPPPRARRPMQDPAISPQTSRLSRAPNIPGIYEDDEGETDTSPEDESSHVPGPTVRKKMKARLSASRLPLPSRIASPPPDVPRPLIIATDAKSSKKKPSRRQSGLLTVDTRPPSPVVGSPTARDSARILAEDDDDDDMAITDEMNVDAELEAALKRERKGKAKERERERDDTSTSDSGRTRERERKRRRDDDESSSTTTPTVVESGGKKLKDVTNSPRGRSALPPLDTNTADRDRQRTPETEPSTAVSAAPSLLPFPSNQSTPMTTPAQTPHPLTKNAPSIAAYLPSPRPSSSPPPLPDTTSETEGAALSGGRATRTRKSVNYAEPKLNTKMRKPDPETGTSSGTGTATKKRLSVSTKPLLATAEDSEARSSLEFPKEQPATKTPKKRPTSSSANYPPPPPAAFLSDGPEPRTSFETGPVVPPRPHSQPQEIKSRPASDSPPLQLPRPNSRPSSSSSTSFRPISSSHAYVTVTPSAPNGLGATTVKRKKSRAAYVDPDDFDDESDGAQADAEFGGGTKTGWVNLDGRRKSTVHGGSGATIPGSSNSRGTERKMEGDDGRRHSMAV